MTMDVRFEKIVKSVAELEEDFALLPDQKLKADLDVDSLKLIDIVLLIEEEFGVELSEDGLADVETVGHLWSAVDRATAA